MVEQLTLMNKEEIIRLKAAKYQAFLQICHQLKFSVDSEFFSSQVDYDTYKDNMMKNRLIK